MDPYEVPSLSVSINRVLFVLRNSYIRIPEKLLGLRACTCMPAGSHQLSLLGMALGLPTTDMHVRIRID